MPHPKTIPECLPSGCLSAHQHAHVASVQNKVNYHTIQSTYDTRDACAAKTTQSSDGMDDDKKDTGCSGARNKVKTIIFVWMGV